MGPWIYGTTAEPVAFTPCQGNVLCAQFFGRFVFLVIFKSLSNPINNLL